MDLSDGLISGGILPHLHQIFTGDYDASIRADSCALLHDFIRSCTNLADVHPEEATNYMREIVNGWMEVLIANMDGEVKIGVVVCRTLVAVCKACKVGGVEMFERGVAMMQGYHTRYVEGFVEGVVGCEDVDSRGRGVGMEVLLAGVVDLMACLIGRDDVRVWLENGDNMVGVLGVLVGYAMVSGREMVSWSESVGEVVCEENEASFAFSLRKRVLEFVLVSVLGVYI
jgi:hypothetical protein